MKCLFLQVKYTLAKGTREEFYRRFRDNNITEMSMAEEGNIEYEILLPHNYENEIYILEKWENPECLEKHKHSLHYAILGELKAKYVSRVEIQKYWLTDFEEEK